jgi:hypothetical protein
MQHPRAISMQRTITKLFGFSYIKVAGAMYADFEIR